MGHVVRRWSLKREQACKMCVSKNENLKNGRGARCDGHTLEPDCRAARERLVFVMSALVEEGSEARIHNGPKLAHVSTMSQALKQIEEQKPSSKP